MFEYPMAIAQPEPVASTYIAPSSSGANGNYRIYNSIVLIQNRANSRIVPPIGDVYAFPSRAKNKSIAADTVSVSDVVNTLKEVFGLNNVQIADLVGVSRPSLYNHLTGKEDPKPKSMAEYRDMWRLASVVKSQVSADIKPGLKSILVNGKTLLSHLRDGDRSDANIISVCQHIAKKLAQDGVRTPSVLDQKQAVRAHSTMS